jgi:hypothetical protein
VLPIRIFLTINVVLLTAGPILLLSLAYTKYTIEDRHILEQQRYTANVNDARAVWRQRWNSFTSKTWLSDLRGVGKFWLAVLLGVGLQVLLIVGYVNLNPFVRNFS